MSARLKLSYVTLLSDTHAKGAASRAFGYWDARKSISDLAAVVVKNGKVVFRGSGKPGVTTLINVAK